jgi:hypothetical protein
MIKQILEMLRFDEFYAQSETIEIAKGKYKLTSTVKDRYKQGKREIKWLKKEL